MPSQVIAVPISAAAAIARPGLLATRSAVAAGPISSAVLSTAPMTTADSDTATASAARYAIPTARTGTPRAAASSGLSEVSSSTRDSTAITASASTPDAISAGTVSGLITNIEPNRIVNDAPVVLLVCVPRYRNRAAAPSAAPRTTPVATSRPRRRCTPISSMIAAPATPAIRNPQNWLTPMRNAPAPPVVATSASECPANDWPRMTVSTPTTPEVTATTVPTRNAVRTAPLLSSPGSTM